MIAELHENLQKPLVVRATRLLLTFNDGTPFAFAVEYANGHMRLFRAGDPNFVEQLKIHGFDKTVIVETRDIKAQQVLTS